MPDYRGREPVVEPVLIHHRHGVREGRLVGHGGTRGDGVEPVPYDVGHYECKESGRPGELGEPAALYPRYVLPYGVKLEYVSSRAHDKPRRGPLFLQRYPFTWGRQEGRGAPGEEAD